MAGLGTQNGDSRSEPKPLERKWWYPVWSLLRDPFSPQEALYALLAAAVMIDGERAHEETIELTAIAGRSRELCKLPPAAIAKIRAKIDPGLVSEGDRIHKLVDRACASLPKDWRVSAYAHAADLVFADRMVRVSEQRFLILVAEKLKIAPALAEEILTQLKIKNEHLDFNTGAAASAPTSTPPDPDSPYASLARTITGVRGAMSKEEALYAILGLAVFADGRERKEEIDELHAIAVRTKTLAAVTAEQRAKVRESVWPQLVKDKRPALFDNACVSLPENLRMPAFAHAVDITFADRRVVTEEVAFLQKLAEALGIAPRAAEDMTKVLKLKNEH